MVRFAALYLRGFVRKDEGQDLLEYALLVALIALGAVFAVGLAGGQVQRIFNAIATALAGIPAGGGA